MKVVSNEVSFNRKNWDLPDILAPAIIPVQPLNKTAKTVIKFWVMPVV